MNYIFVVYGFNADIILKTFDDFDIIQNYFLQFFLIDFDEYMGFLKLF